MELQGGSNTFQGLHSLISAWSRDWDADLFSSNFFLSPHTPINAEP